MRSGTQGFQGVRLTQARKCRGITQVALGQMMDKDSATISRWEQGGHLPEGKTVKLLSEKLNVPTSFFLQPLPKFDDAPLFFRSMASATGASREKVQVRLRLAQEISDTLQQWVELPKVIIESLNVENHNEITDQDIEAAAEKCRNLWKIGDGPISDMLLAMENSGIVIIKEEFGVSNMDGLSNWHNERPYVMIAKDKDNCVRSRMDAAHELGHLVLHRNINSKTLNKPADFKEIERQAFLFAGAFLMPAKRFSQELHSPSLNTFLALKERWKTSVAAMIMRCRTLGIIGENDEKRLWKQYSYRKWRTDEPFDSGQYCLEVEDPRILRRSIDLLLQENVKNIEQLLNEIRLPPNDIEVLANLPRGYLTGKVADIVEMPKLKESILPKESTGTGEVIPFKKSKI